MISIRGLTLTVGRFTLDDISFDVANGDYFILLGPTGSGKTLFIECLCGLLRPAKGTIEIGGRDVTALAPRLREIGYVPQNQGLFPHLKVKDNIAFPLKARRLGSAEVARRTAPLVELLGIRHLLERWPTHLSGGERQKVALVRALASRPRVLVLDEPVSALDESSRERLCLELHRIHQELQVTTLHVSHSVEEALSVGNRAAVLNAGHLVQTGTITDLLRRPATEFVARFFRSENVFQATAAPLPDGSSELSFGGHAVRVPGSHSGPVTFVVRPESIEVHPPAVSLSNGNGFLAVLKGVRDRGVYHRVEFDAGGVPIVAYVTAGLHSFAPGHKHAIAFPPHAIHIIPS